MRAAFEAWAASIGLEINGRYAESLSVLCAEEAFKAGYQAGRVAPEAAWAEADEWKRVAAAQRDEALLRQALDALAYWLEYGETPGSHDIIQRTHDVLRKRLK
jgi:hypothetical protein